MTDQKITPALKPCPFCGETPKNRLCGGEGNTFRWWVVSCPSCSATPGDVRINTMTMDREPALVKAQADGEEAWNRRPIEDEKDARIEALKAENAELRAKLEQARVKELEARIAQMECRTCDGDGTVVVRADGIAVSAPCPNCAFEARQKGEKL